MSIPQPWRIAFQGELGGYSEEAIRMMYPASCELVAFPAALEAATAVAEGRADYAVLPIENTIAGSMSDTHTAVDRTVALHAVAECVVDVHHCLMAPFGASVESVATVLSHTLTLAQCSEFFRAHPRMQTHGLFDTAGAAREVAQLGDPSFAAVAGRAAAGRFGLDVLVADIADRTDNQTRFLSFACAPVTPEPHTPVRTMVAFTTNDAPGALLFALEPLARHRVNLRRIDTRPAGEPWSYRFFVECDHEMGDERVHSAFEDIARATPAVRVVGTFPRWRAGRRGSIGWSPTDGSVIR